MYIPIDFTWLEATSLACVRITAFLVFAPPFSHATIPMRIRAMLGVGLALAVSPVVTAGYERMETSVFLLALAGQAITGALLGFLVGRFFGGHPIYALAIGGGSQLLAAALTLRVEDRDDVEATPWDAEQPSSSA